MKKLVHEKRPAMVVPYDRAQRVQMVENRVLMGCALGIAIFIIRFRFRDKQCTDWMKARDCLHRLYHRGKDAEGIYFNDELFGRVLPFIEGARICLTPEELRGEDVPKDETPIVWGVNFACGIADSVTTRLSFPPDLALDWSVARAGYLHRRKK